MFWIILLSLLPVAAVFGSMTYFEMALALGLAVIVWMRPQEAIGAGMLYLFACHVVFPAAARLDTLAESAWEMYYWAVGLLIIPAAAVAEQSPYDPEPGKRDNYSHSQILTEKRVLEIARETGLPVTIFRPGIIYGPGRALEGQSPRRIVNRVDATLDFGGYRCLVRPAHP